MRIPKFIRVLLYKLGIDSCDACGLCLIRKDGWYGKGWDMWGPFLYCRECNARMESQYDGMMRRELAAVSSRQSPI